MRVEEDVRRLDVAVDVVLVVDEVERPRYVQQPAVERTGRHRGGLTVGARLEPRPQASAPEIRHDDVRIPFELTDIDDPDNVRVAEPDERADLPLEPGQ